MDDVAGDVMLSMMNREQLKQAVRKWRDRATRAEEKLESAEEELESAEVHLRRAADRESSLRSELIGFRNGMTPVTMEALEAAWEAAEVADVCRKGDVLIEVDPQGRYSVWRTDGPYLLSRDVRIRSRAPKREPWQDLADDLADRSALMGEDAIETAAKALHAAGWRKGGEES